MWLKRWLNRTFGSRPCYKILRYTFWPRETKQKLYLQQQLQQLLDEVEPVPLLLLPRERDVLAGREDQDVQRGQVGPRVAVGVCTELAQDAHAVQVADLVF